MQSPGPGGHPPLVMVPGLGLGPGAWTPTVRALQAALGSRCPAVTTVPLPGYGLPRRPRDSLLSPQALAGRLVRDLEGLPPVVLLGHSASCQIVAHVVRQAPGAVAGTVLVGPTTDPRAGTWPGLVRRWLATARREPAWQVPVLVGHYRRSGLSTMARAMSAARTDRIDSVLAEVHCPVLLVRGRHDRIVPADWLASLRETGPPGAGRRRCVTLSAGAHMVPLTHGHLVAEAVVGLLRDLRSG